MVTQSQIAKLAGVSRSTVERVINNHGEVNPETRKRIQKIIDEMGYRPNRGGRTLAIRQKQLKVGCIIIKADNPFYEELNKGIQLQADELKAFGIEVIVEQTVFQTTKMINKIDEMLTKGISALVIQPTTDPEMVTKLQELERLNIPIVTVNTDLPDYDSGLCYVGNDFYLCGKTAANLLALITSSKCNIGIVTGFFNAKSHSDRIDGFTEFIHSYPNMHICSVVENHDDEMESYYAVKTMLKDHPEIDALFLVAGGVYGAGKAIKNVIDEDQRSINVISFDDVETTRQLVREGIIQATICQQPVRQGKMALSVLLDYFMDDKKPDNKRLYTDIQIKLRANIDSTN